MNGSQVFFRVYRFWAFFLTIPLRGHARGTMADQAGQKKPYDYQERYRHVRQKPLSVYSVEVKGDERTRPGLFARVLDPVYRASTLDELRVRCVEANAVLNSYDIFDRVDIEMDAGPREHPDSAKVTVEVSEKKKLNLKGGAYVSQQGEGSMEVSVGLNNALGYAEKLDVEFIKGHERSNSCTLAWNQPRVGNVDVDVVTRAFQQVSCSKRLSSFDETARGVSVTAVGGGPATVDYSLVWREIADPTRLASKSIRQQLGHSLKSSVSYTYQVDERDRPVRPGAGYLARVRSELAGVGWDPQMTRFLKHEAEVQAAHTPAEGVTFFASAKLGAMMPLGQNAKDPEKGTCIADRFFLGGIGSLRGFEPHGAGPSDERRPPPTKAAASGENLITRDALGGDVLAQLFASYQLEPEWSKLRDIGVYGHFFVNAGTLMPWITGERKRVSGRELADSFRASVGVGLVFPLPVGNIEVNYCHTLRSRPGDRVKNGLQIGLATALV